MIIDGQRLYLSPYPLIYEYEKDNERFERNSKVSSKKI